MIKTLSEIYRENLKFVKEQKITHSDLKWLLKDEYHLSEEDFILKQDTSFDDANITKKINRLLEGFPLAYLLGYCPFLGLNFLVSPDVLIPRNETEELVLLVEKEIKDPNKDISLIDIGCGSGVIALSLDYRLQQKMRNIKVYACDVSINAIKIALKNQMRFKTNVTIFQSDVFNKFSDKVDYIVSNPPYINKGNYVEESVLKYEPHLALFAEEQGLEFYHRIMEEGRRILKPQGKLFFEISPELKSGLLELSKRYYPSADVEFLNDLNGLLRFMIIRLN